MHKPQLKAEPFPLSDVKLLGGPFADATKRTADYLLTVEPDRLLHSFRQHSGLAPKGKIYGGWENSGLAGHSLGHYLTACSQEFASSGDKRFKDKIDYIVDELVACQKSRPDGYIAAMPDGDRMWAEIKKGEIRSRGFDLNGLWSPWYTHHKVYAGLLDAYRLTGNKAALGVAEKFADWAIETTKGLTDEQWEKMLGTEYGGMNDAMAELYAATGQQKYLDLARHFYDHRVLDPLANGEDDLPGKHSNTQIPKIIGLARLYELTGDEKDQKIAEFFWRRIVEHHTYAIGGNSNHEYLGPPDHLADRLSSNTCETCNTYNMLKLTRHLFEWEPRAELFDYYERAHLNHILASQNPADGMVTYFMPLGTGSHREYSDPTDNWTCCHGSGMENHTKHADSAYFHHGGDRLWVNLFIPTELTWRENGMKLRQTTNYPNDGAVKIVVESGSPKKFEMNIRHPGWAEGEMIVKVNGVALARSNETASYLTINRTWHAGDRIEFTVPMRLDTEAMPDAPNRLCVKYGPLVLAADLGPDGGPQPRTPVLVTGTHGPSDWLAQAPGKPMEWTTKGVGRPAELTFRPFYTLHTNRYGVYFDRFTEDQWKQAEAEFRAEEARQRDLEARTVDNARIGEMQPERDHNLKSEKNDIRGANGRNWRTPLEGGWFEFEMKVDPAKPMELVLTYWGSDRSHPEFDILVDGQKIATEDQPHRKSNVFFDETHAIPSELTKGKSKIVVRIQAIPGKPAGSVAGARAIVATRG
ncbi:glycoside hydrolase family 127 protein [Fimbriimonas ginsengisoli]|uniref:Glycoside hydrolase family 127 protein n=1 Tax=Fimbriimonas ginsengisoli Gsoil 348 TaxID=661478 RepID=A0A068NMH7_FIMGI|nr:glycoside hydrolase family 127 protein [Fimbriimonas ginsengisoli]AIE84661.1 hypothetical protein OP10G_1293 [Fimbriimonas ginsengisoli Gsoil 348]